MMLVADEGVDKSIVDALRAIHHTVTYFAEAGAGSSDKEVLAAASDAQSLLLTCDKDFGELVYRQGLTNSGVVLIRLDGLSSESKGRIVSQAIKDHIAEMRARLRSFLRACCEYAVGLRPLEIVEAVPAFVVSIPRELNLLRRRTRATQNRVLSA